MRVAAKRSASVIVVGGLLPVAQAALATHRPDIESGHDLRARCRDTDSGWGS